MFGKNKEENPEQEIPVSGNRTKLSAEALDRMNENEKARKEAEKTSKFFKLEIGEETIVSILPEKSLTFKSETRDHQLVDKFRYYLYDRNVPDVEKVFDCYWKMSEAIDNEIRRLAELDRPFEMKIKCVPRINDKTKPAYVIESLP